MLLLRVNHYQSLYFMIGVLLSDNKSFFSISIEIDICKTFTRLSESTCFFSVTRLMFCPSMMLKYSWQFDKTVKIWTVEWDYEAYDFCTIQLGCPCHMPEHGTEDYIFQCRISNLHTLWQRQRYLDWLQEVQISLHQNSRITTPVVQPAATGAVQHHLIIVALNYWDPRKNGMTDGSSGLQAEIGLFAAAGSLF